jgi:hypothetical protein
MRFVAWLGGILFGLGLAIDALVAATAPGEITPAVAVAMGIGLFALFQVSRTAAKSVAARSATRVAAWTSLLVLLLLSPLQGTMDTKDKGYRTQSLVELLDIRELQHQSHSDSGRYTTRPELTGFLPDTTPTITITSDGWTAAVEDPRLPGVQCAIFEGGTPLAPAVHAGEPRCTDPFRAVLLAPGALLMLIGAGLVAVIRRRSSPAP